MPAVLTTTNARTRARTQMAFSSGLSVGARSHRSLSPVTSLSWERMAAAPCDAPRPTVFVRDVPSPHSHMSMSRFLCLGPVLLGVHPHSPAQLTSQASGVVVPTGCFVPLPAVLFFLFQSPKYICSHSAAFILLILCCQYYSELDLPFFPPSCRIVVGKAQVYHIVANVSLLFDTDSACSDTSKSKVRLTVASFFPLLSLNKFFLMLWLWVFLPSGLMGVREGPV